MIIFCKYLQLQQGWNWVSITDPDDPLTHTVIWVRPGFDPDVTQFNQASAETYISDTTMISDFLPTEFASVL